MNLLNEERKKNTILIKSKKLFEITGIICNLVCNHLKMEECLPEAGAGVDDPVSNLLLPDPLLHEGLLAAKQLHGQLAVGGREDVLEVVPHTQVICFTETFAAHRRPDEETFSIRFFCNVCTLFIYKARERSRENLASS